MSYKADYQKYLRSPQWKALRAKARERAGNKCEMCGGSPDHVHHVKYPKRHKDDHLDNLVVVCESCHQKLHGIRDEIYADDWIATAIGLKFSGRVTVVMALDPIPEEYRKPVTLTYIAQKISEGRADFIRNILDGDVLETGKAYVREFPIDHQVFEGGFSEMSAVELIGRIWEDDATASFTSENPSDLATQFLDLFSLGPIWLPCRVVT